LIELSEFYHRKKNCDVVLSADDYEVVDVEVLGRKTKVLSVHQL